MPECHRRKIKIDEIFIEREELNMETFKNEIKTILRMMHKIGRPENPPPHYANSKYFQGFDDGVSACENMITKLTGISYDDCQNDE